MSQDPAATTGAYLRLLWRRKWQLLLPVVVATAVAYGVSAQQAPVYETHADLLFEGPRVGGAPAPSVDVLTEAQIVTSPAVAAAAAESLGGAATAAEVTAAVSAEQVKALPMLRVSARAGSARTVRKLVDASVEAYLESRADRIDEEQATALAKARQRLAELAEELDSVTGELAAAEGLDDQDPSETPALRARRDQLVSRLALQHGRLDELQGDLAQTTDDVSVLVPAVVPRAPHSPQPMRAGSIGALVGLLLGSALLLLRQQLADPVHGLDDVEAALVAPALAVVPKIRRRRRREHVALHEAPTSPAAESYRILRANLAAAGVGTRHRVLLITSATEREGKSTTAANVATAFTEAGADVVLVDADFRRPKLHTLLGVANEGGLANVLTADSTEKTSITTISSEPGRLGLLPAGSERREPARILSSPRLAPMLTNLRERAIVIMDSPPALPVADAAMLAGHADAVLLVVDPRRSNRAALERLRSRLAAIGTPVVGFVLHAAGPEYSSYQGYHGYRGYRGYQAAELAKLAPDRATRRTKRNKPASQNPS